MLASWTFNTPATTHTTKYDMPAVKLRIGINTCL
jgi:hypothetical protein